MSILQLVGARGFTPLMDGSLLRCYSRGLSADYSTVVAVVGTNGAEPGKTTSSYVGSPALMQSSTPRIAWFGGSVNNGQLPKWKLVQTDSYQSAFATLALNGISTTAWTTFNLGMSIVLRTSTSGASPFYKWDVLFSHDDGVTTQLAFKVELEVIRDVPI